MNSLTSLPPQGRAALCAGVVGNWVDNLHMFLPLVALAPALPTLAGPTATAGAGAAVVVAMLLGRPLGGVIFGRISDRWGRTRTARLALLGTAICSAAIAAIPGYQSWGMGTMVVILLARFLGGIFIAGEYSAAIPLAMEWSVPERRGWFSGLILSMAPWAQGAIAFSTAALLAWLGPENYAAWGWRVLFAFGAAASVGMYLYYRTHVADTAQTQEKINDDAPATWGIRSLLTGEFARRFWNSFTVMSGLWLMTVATVLVLPSYMGRPGGLSAGDGATAMGIASACQAIFMAIGGHISTWCGRRRTLISWAIIAATAGVATWWWAAGATTLATGAFFAAAAQILTVSAYGPIAAYLSEAFPTAVRSTGYGMAYSWSLLIPMLYPLWMPLVVSALGARAAVVAILVLGAILVVAGAACGPALRKSEVSQPLDEIALRSRI